MKLLPTCQLLLASLLAGVATSQSWSVVPLGIPGARPQAIAPNGDVVGWYGVSGGVRAFVHDAAMGAWVDLGALPGASFSAARGINVVGQVVGSSWVSAIQQPGRAFLFTPGAGFSDLGVLGGPTSQAFCVDHAGNVGGQADGSAFTPEAVLVPAGASMQSVQAGVSGNVLAIEASGWAGGVLGSNQAFYLQPGSATPVIVPLPLATPNGRVTSVAANGWIAGEMSDPSGSPSYAFRFHVPSGALDNLGSISRFGTVGGIDSVGNVVATRQISIQSTPVGLISVGGGQLLTLDSLLTTPGWAVRSATGFNESGQICGRAEFQGGGIQAVRLDPVSLPGLANVAVVGGGCSTLVVRAAPARVGRLWEMGMRGALPAQPLISLVGVGHHGPVPLPGSACDIYLSGSTALLWSLSSANAGGGWADRLSIPQQSSLAGFQLTMQLLVADASTPLGLAATEAVQVTVGI